MKPEDWGFVIEVWPSTPWRRAESRSLGTGFLLSRQRAMFIDDGDAPEDSVVRLRSDAVDLTGSIISSARVRNASVRLIQLDSAAPMEPKWTSPRSPAEIGRTWETWWFPRNVSRGMLASGTIAALRGPGIDLGESPTMIGDPRGAPVLVDGALVGVVIDGSPGGRWLAASYADLEAVLKEWLPTNGISPQYSATVRTAQRELADAGPVTAAAIVAAVQPHHPGYGGGRFAGVSLDVERGRRRPVESWLLHASQLYDGVDVARSHHQVIDGHLLIAGLAQIDPDLRSMLEADDFLDILRSEIEVQPHAPGDATTGEIKLASDARSLVEQPGAFDSVDLVLGGLVSAAVPVAQVLRGLLASQLTMTDEEFVTSLLEAQRATAGTHASVVPELFAPAAALALRTTHSSEIGARHLLAVGVIDLPPQHPVRLVVGSPQTLRTCLRKAVGRTSPDDSPEAWDEFLLGPRQVLVGGYTRDVGWPEPGQADESADLLDRMGEAEMFAALITDKDMVPPLAIGLFGSWGSGKSFFMKLIHRAVAAKVQGRYAQIRFNAWHYSDTNLWASLGDQLFEGLATHVSGPEQDEAAALRRQLEVHTEAGRSLAARSAQVAAERERLQERLSAAARQREIARSKRSAENVRRLAEAIKADDQADHDLAELGKVIGVTDAVGAYRALAGEAAYLRDGSRAFAAVAKDPLRWSTLAAAAALLLIGALAALAPAAMPAWVATGAGTVALTLANAARVVRSAGRIAGTARRFYARAAAADELVRATPSDEEAGLAGQLRQAEAREAAIVAQLAETDLRIAQLETEIAELSGERRLYRFLTERAAGDQYRSQLGMVSMIRKDLETLVRRLASQRAVERIVLYVDDLDRCEPTQVVAVLQAVHLLCGMPYFVVLVGVDPNWLERSLRRKYGRLVEGATPREYLEKIFQIPYVLPPMGDGFTAMVTILARPPEEGRTTEIAEDQVSAAAEPAPETPMTDPQAESGAQQPEDGPITVEPGSAAAPSGALDDQPARLELTELEVELLTAFGALVRTPRAATRLLNLYRLVRTTRYVGRSSRFLGTDGSPGEYLVVTQILATTASPAVLAEVMARLSAATGPETTWEDLLSEPGPLHLGEEWARMANVLIDIARRFGAPQELDPYRTWAGRLARFTFTLPSEAVPREESPSWPKGGGR